MIPKELTSISWYDEVPQEVIIEISEKVVVMFSLEEFSHVLHLLIETKDKLLEIPEIKIGSIEVDGKTIDELIVVTDDEEYN